MKAVRILSRCIATLKAVRQYWSHGGYTKVAVAQLDWNKSLSGRRVLVTGGSAGIGLAIAKKCISEGAKVVITGRNQEKLESAVEYIGDSSVFALQWDVADVTLLGQKLDEATRLLGGEPDVLVNNAGILGGHRKFTDLTEEVWDELVAVNSKGLVFLTQCAIKRWRQSQMTAKVINMSSMRGTLGVQDGPYGMSKWALNGLTRGLGLELAPYGIIVNGIAPGIIATDSINVKGVDPAENAHLEYVPTQRIGTVEEIAELAVFLMSDAANYIVGQTIVCDGGYTLKN